MQSFLSTLLALFIAITATAQTQTIRGTVLDDQSGFPIIGATIQVLNTENSLGAATDIEGRFSIADVPIGRQTVQIRYLGYETRTIDNIQVTSGKSANIEVLLKEQIEAIEEVTINATKKDQTVNEMALVSSRMLSMVEAKKYSGTRGDPSRMAQNFAGVSGASDDRNDIIIRGNSPGGVLWRIEGFDVPNPNHFGSLGSTGGPVTILNTNNLKNSDFLTGAFPAEYGNATAGVFDLTMQNGNRDEYEFLGQVGFNGFEFGAEGPLSKNKKGSFIANYRYSTLALIGNIGVDVGTGSAIPQYQDLTFKINVPTEKAGKFVLFGLSGLSYIEFLNSILEEDDENLFSNAGEDLRFRSNMGILGGHHTYFFNEKTSSRIGFAFSGIQTTADGDSLDANRTPLDLYDQKNTQTKYSLDYDFNQKINAKNKIQVGANYDLYGLNLKQTQEVPNGEQITFRDFGGNLHLLRFFAQHQHRFNDQLTLVSGIHNQFLTLNNSFAIEPRVALKYQFVDNQSLNIAAGIHHQLQPLEAYFFETRYADGSTALTNKNLDFMRSSQLVVGHNLTFGGDWRLKTELYTQYLDKVGVEQRASDFSLINAGADFAIPDVDSLVNEGTGLNYGVELTLEKFFSKNYYGLFTASIFDARYRGSDDVWRNTAFNNKFIFNFLAGKEFPINKKHAISVDTRVTFGGGKPFTPIDLEASREAGETIRSDFDILERNFRNYFRFDFKVAHIWNGKRFTQKFSVDIQNITNRDNIFSQQYNRTTDRIQTTTQIGLFPDVTYQIVF